MKIEKRKIIDIPAVYVAAEMSVNNRRYFFVASENKGEHAYIIDGTSLTCADLWKGDTGVMNIIGIPGYNQLLCITKFYPIFQSKETAISLLEPAENDIMSIWNKKEIMQLPYCHRIGIIKNINGLFLLCCTLCENKDFQEDWTKPGAIFISPIPAFSNIDKWKLTKIFDGLTKNHGLFIENDSIAYIASENGVMQFDFKNYKSGEKLFPTLLTTEPTSDLWVMNNRGKKMIGTIEPFHGNRLRIYECYKNNYHPLWSCNINFGHVVWLGEIYGKDAIIVGNRGGRKELKLLFWRTDEQIDIDEDVGPTQITVFKDNKIVKILSANHGAGNVSLYTIKN